MAGAIVMDAIGIAAATATGRLGPIRKTGRRRKLAASSRAQTVVRTANLGSNPPKYVLTRRRGPQPRNRSGIRRSSPCSRVPNRRRKQKATLPTHNAANAAVGAAEDVDAEAVADATTSTDRTQVRTRTQEAARTALRRIRARNRATTAAAKIAPRAAAIRRRVRNRKGAWICLRRRRVRPSRDASLRKHRDPRRKVATRAHRVPTPRRRRSGRQARPRSRGPGVAAHAAMNR